MAAAIVAGDCREAARLITRIENNELGDPELLQELREARTTAPVIGVTGAPGCGKSTLVDQMVATWRAAGKCVAVLAVDPSSPFTGGAILGDRVRLQRHASDPHVFIRSMSSRGTLGGLALTTSSVIAVLAAMPWDLIIVETVGVGQNEIDIVRHAGTVVLVETPASGDAVQSFKSGIMEIADIFVINKADQEGADRRVQFILEALKNSALNPHRLPVVLKTEALSGVGVPELIAAIEAHVDYSMAHPKIRKLL